jgi:divalent metal cation (Fe/Co/Zn/Cd) transporter
MSLIFLSLVYSLYYSQIKVLIDAVIPPEQVQVIRSYIGPESVETCRDVQNEPI